MSAAATLKWISRALFGVGLLFFVAFIVYIVTRSGEPGVGADGSEVTFVSEREMDVLGLLFSSVVWSWLAGGAVNILAHAVSWPRALLEIAPLVGFGLLFAAFHVFASSSGGGSVAGLIGTGVLMIVVAKIAHFAAFGAKEAVVEVQQAVAHVKDTIADSRSEPHASQPPLHSGFITPPRTVFTPEPLEPERPWTGPQV